MQCPYALYPPFSHPVVWRWHVLANHHFQWTIAQAWQCTQKDLWSPDISWSGATILVCTVWLGLIFFIVSHNYHGLLIYRDQPVHTHITSDIITIAAEEEWLCTLSMATQLASSRVSSWWTYSLFSKHHASCDSHSLIMFMVFMVAGKEAGVLSFSPARETSLC